MMKQNSITQIQNPSYCFLSFDDDGENWTGRIWITNENDEDNMIEFFNGDDKSDIIEKVKCWALKHNYDVEW